MTYATWAGSAGEVAEYVGKTLKKDGYAVDVMTADDVHDLESYQAVIVGSAIHAGKIHPHVQAFLGKNQEILANKKVAYFIVCLTMKDDSEENREVVLSYLENIKTDFPQINPVGAGFFAGELNYKNLSFQYTLMMKAMSMKEADYRDWDEIRMWTKETENLLLSL